jgi:hypothetical protein
MYERESQYSYGDFYAKAVVDKTVASIGTPKVEKEENQQLIDDYMEEWKTKLTKIMVDINIGETIFVRLYKPQNENSNLYQKSPKIKLATYGESSIEEVEYNDRENVKSITIKGEEDEEEITETITNQKITKKKGNNVVSERKNHYGFVPVIEVSTQSEIKPIMTLIRAYHKIKKNALNNFGNHSNPKLKFKVDNVNDFLENNFSEDTIQDSAKGKVLDIKGKELMFFRKDEDSEYMSLESSTGDAEILLKFVFYCIVIASSIPEYLWGTHIKSSNASVTEQLLPFKEKINRKRTELNSFYKLLFRMLLAMESQINNIGFDNYDVNISWDEILRNESEKTQLLQQVTVSLEKAIFNDFLSRKSAFQYIKKHIDTTADSWKKEQEQIQKENVNDRQAVDQLDQLNQAG